MRKDVTKLVRNCRQAFVSSAMYFEMARQDGEAWHEWMHLEEVLYAELLLEPLFGTEVLEGSFRSHLRRIRLSYEVESPFNAYRIANKGGHRNELVPLDPGEAFEAQFDGFSNFELGNALNDFRWLSGVLPDSDKEVLVQWNCEATRFSIPSTTEP